jgi:SAM-dependent methyltransferase
MGLPDALDEERTAGLTALRPAPRRAVVAKRLAKRAAGMVLRRAEAAGLLQARAAAHAANVRLDGVESAVDRMGQELAQGELSLDHLGRVQAHLEETTKAIEAYGDGVAEVQTLIQKLTANQELLKAELRGLQTTLAELGMAIAPGAGLEAAGLRFAELRERVNGIDRRLRTPATGLTNNGAAGDAPAGHGPQSDLFDYVGFENRFRGDPRAVADTLWERYGRRLAGSAPVVDLGCGQAQLLRRLRAEGVPASGVDTDPTSVIFARDDGLDVVQADALSWLGEQPEHSIGSLVATHLIEHLQLDDLVRLLELAATRLVPEGLLIAETPNPETLIVLGNSYVLDPTHVRPIHPSLLTFLLEGAGFRDVRLEFFAPAEGYYLPLITDPEAPPWSASINAGFRQLNEVLFGPQDYAALATTPG